MHYQVLFAILWGALCSASAVSYPRPDLYKTSPWFSLKVNGTYMYTVNYAGYDYVQLSMDEGHPTEFRIASLSRSSITNYRISPAQLAINATIDGNELIFSVTKAHYLIIKIDDVKEFVILADPAETNQPAEKGAGIYNVLDYGASQNDTGRRFTSGVQKALDAARGHVGAIVYVPVGLYYISNLMIYSQTSLYLAGGSVLRFTGNGSDYNTLYHKSDLYNGTWWIQTEIDSKDIKVYGRGTIDGDGYATRTEHAYMAELLVPVGTTNFVADGLLVRDSSFWAVTPIQVTDATLTNMKILERLNLIQDDGIDVNESTNVTISRAIAISDDDAFSAKTWPANTGTTVPYPYAPRPNQDILFENCLAWTNCIAYKIGQGVSETQDNVRFENSVVYHAGVGLGIDHRYGAGAATNIRYENIDIEALSGAPSGLGSWLDIVIEGGSDGAGPVDGVYVHNIRVRDVGDKIGKITGYNSSILTSTVTLRDIYMFANSTPATTLIEMNIMDTNYSKDITIG